MVVVVVLVAVIVEIVNVTEDIAVAWVMVCVILMH